MRPLDWLVLFGTIGCFVAYGVWRGRGSKDTKTFLLAGRQLRWGTVVFSIMATQASAVTFLSVPGQAFTDGMRFVQYYFGLPIAMVILSVTAVPIFHRLNVYTAYEYLEHRFDLKTRTLTTAIFLIQRGLGAGFSIYAPSIVLSVMLGIDIRLTSTLIGAAVIVYSTSGGVKAINQTHVLQLTVVMLGMVAAFVAVLLLLPANISFIDALHVAGASGKLNVIDFSFDLNNRYNFWSGLIGGMFVALAYFGTDQSQVQRYLTGKSVAQSRVALLVNGMLKVPMQFFLLLIGAMVFVFYQFVTPPLMFNPVEVERIRASAYANRYSLLERDFAATAKEKTDAVQQFVSARRTGNTELEHESSKRMETHSAALGEIRTAAATVLKESSPIADTNDTNYIFLSFVTKYLPAGLVGLIFACIFAASMSSASSELSALATTTVIDIYKRFTARTHDDHHYLKVSRIAMAFWGVYAIFFAQFATRVGSLVEAVNILGSLFYGTMLGVFLLAFYIKSVGGTAAFVGALCGEAVVIVCYFFSGISWLWYNVVGCGVVVAVALIFTALANKKGPGVTA
jgi:Na+/proline symporter